MNRGHFVPAARLKEDYPFTYDLEVIGKETSFDFEVDFILESKADLKKEIHDKLIKVFDYYTYFNKKPIEELEMVVKVNVYDLEIQNGRRVTLLRSIDYLRIFNFKSNYSYVLIESIDQLKKALVNEKGESYKVTSYDCETTGLNPEYDKIVGFTFAVEDKKGYYVPIGHDKEFEKYNLPKEALEVFYEFMVQSEITYMFNSRFDMRFVEWYNNLFDMGKVKVIDTQINSYLADPDWKGVSLKWAEKHFLGYERPTLEDTMKLYRIADFDTSKLSPKNLLFYAAQDGISTFELGKATNRFQAEFGLAGELDQTILYPLMKMEDRPIKIDVEFLKGELATIKKEKEHIEKRITELIGDVNLNSPKQKVDLFESFGLDTGVKTKSGAMSVNREAVDRMIENMEMGGKHIPEWLKYLGDFSKINILHNTFFNALYEYVEKTDGRIRLNYRVGSTSTGRFSSGKEK